MKDLHIKHIPRVGRSPDFGGPPLTNYKVMLFRLDGQFELEKECLLDAQIVLDDLIKSGDDTSCLKIVIAGPETWIEHNPKSFVVP
jgi:hypothetical protein